jgi:hypothetical protein
MDGIEFFCSRCLKAAIFCGRCWKNQCYCSEECADASRLVFQAGYQSVYAKTPKGRASQKRRDNTRRNKKTTTEQTAVNVEAEVKPIVITKEDRCFRCGGKITFLVSEKTLTSRSLRRNFAYTRGSG